MRKQILYCITFIYAVTNILSMQGMDCIASSSSSTPNASSKTIKHFVSPLTIQHYRALNNQQRYELQDEIEKSSQLQSHPLLDENNRWLFTQIAKELNEQYSDAFIYSLGQTPAYLIATMQAMSLNPERYFCIPFSGNFCDVTNRSVSSIGGKLCLTQTWNIKQHANPHLTLYQPILNASGLQLTDILERYQKNKQKTVIIEFSISCSGIASFLTALFAQKPTLSEQQEIVLHEALEIILLTDPRSTMTDERKIIVPGLKNTCTFTIKLSGNLFTQLSDCDGCDDQLMPKFAYDKWGTVDPFAFAPSRNAYLVLAHIFRFLKD